MEYDIKKFRLAKLATVKIGTKLILRNTERRGEFINDYQIGKITKIIEPTTSNMATAVSLRLNLLYPKTYTDWNSQVTPEGYIHSDNTNGELARIYNKRDHEPTFFNHTEGEFYPIN